MVTRGSHISDPIFLSQFTLVVQEQSGLSLYHHTGLGPLPTRPIPSGLLTEHRLCGLSGPIASIKQSTIIFASSNKKVKTLSKSGGITQIKSSLHMWFYYTLACQYSL